jgi:hypothetical protein
MNPYHRGHSWNPYNCNLLPNRVATLSDVRYRSFQQAPQITSRSAKSRASLALPNYNSSKYFGSSHQLAHFHEQPAGSHHHHHHELMRPPCYGSHCCGGCACTTQPPRLGFCVLNFLSILSDFPSRERLTQKFLEPKAEKCAKL